MSAAAARCLAFATALAVGGCNAQNAILTVEPAGMRACDPPRIATATWDASASASAVSGVKLFVSNGGKETLFTTGVPKASAATGVWTFAGTTFVLRDGESEKELARTVVKNLGECR